MTTNIKPASASNSEIADVLTFRNGKITEFRSFTNRQRALEWAGITP